MCNIKTRLTITSVIRIYGKVYIKLKCNFDCRAGIRAWHVLRFYGANLLAFLMVVIPHIKVYNYKNKYSLVFDLQSDLDFVMITSRINIFAWRIYFTKRWLHTSMENPCINEAGHAKITKVIFLIEETFANCRLNIIISLQQFFKHTVFQIEVKIPHR